MRVIPNACSELTLPDDCFNVVFDVADCVLEAVMSAIAEFIPDAEGDCGEAVIGFVAFDEREQPWDLCNQVVVNIRQIDPHVRKGCLIQPRATLRVEATFAIYPVLIDDSTGVVSLPPIEEQEKANQWLYAVGVAIMLAVVGELFNPTCDTLLPGLNPVVLPLKPLGPKGGCGGWTIEFSIDVPPRAVAAP